MQFFLYQTSFTLPTKFCSNVLPTKNPYYFSYDEMIPGQNLKTFHGNLKSPYVLLTNINHFSNLTKSLRKMMFEIVMFFQHFLNGL